MLLFLLRYGFKSNPFWSNILIDLNKSYRDFPSGSCSFRADLLFLYLQSLGENPTLLSVSIKDNFQIGFAYEKQYKHFCGHKYHHHYAVKLGDLVFDPNLSFRVPVSIDDYKKFVIKYEPRSDLVYQTVGRVHNNSELLYWMKRKKLFSKYSYLISR